MTNDFRLYLLILAGSTYLIRAIPFALLQKKITNRYVRSFLFYIPFTVLAAMTVPAAFYATGHIVSAVVGLLIGCLVAIKGKGLTVVAAVSCASALAVELLYTVLI
ncbi:MAG: AzlD domain-containing protein [Clostridia bacterium]|nr:AzlD domain-containing protein [Clostridia bacterium]